MEIQAQKAQPILHDADFTTEPAEPAAERMKPVVTEPAAGERMEPVVTQLQGRYPPLCTRQGPGTNSSQQGPLKAANSAAP